MVEVDVKVHAAAGTIVMQRGQRGNALSRAMLQALDQALDDLHQEKRVRYVILMGQGSHFSAGMDLAELSRVARLETGSEAIPLSHEVHHDWELLSELLLKILRYPKPVIAAVDGQALGGGFALALACDLIVASTRAEFGSPAAQRGLVGAMVAPLLHFRQGGAVAARMLLTGRSVDSDAAMGMGLLTDLVAADQIWVCADALGQQIATAPRESLQMTKRLLNESIGEALISQLTIAAGLGAAASTTDAAAEGLRAFLEKREPQWP
jgi:enoyl-CoA hydratase/carnithine racemase